VDALLLSAMTDMAKGQEQGVAQGGLASVFQVALGHGWPHLGRDWQAH
jgi:hypothetical protein